MAGNHLLELINDVLDVSRIDAGNLKVFMERVLIADVVAASLKLIGPQAQAIGISLINDIGDSEVAIQADFTRLKKILINLLSNA